MFTFIPTIASKTRPSSGKTHWPKCSSSVGTLSNSYDLYAMATHRKLLAAMSSIAALKYSWKKCLCIVPKFYNQVWTHNKRHSTSTRIISFKWQFNRLTNAKSFHATHHSHHGFIQTYSPIQCCKSNVLHELSQWSQKICSITTVYVNCHITNA